MNRIEKTFAFLKETLDKSEYFKENPCEKEYRINHSIRVANLAGEIAHKENLDKEGLIIGCILHDVSYCNGFNSDEDRINHGRMSAQMSLEFLKTLSLNDKLVDQILYGIAIHVDDVAYFSGERTLFSLSISDCDNIDRFGAYRIFENLRYNSFEQMVLIDQIIFVDAILVKLEKYTLMELATATAIKLWNRRIKFQISFYKQLRKQLLKSEFKLLCK